MMSKIAGFFGCALVFWASYRLTRFATLRVLRFIAISEFEEFQGAEFRVPSLRRLLNSLSLGAIVGCLAHYFWVGLPEVLAAGQLQVYLAWLPLLPAIAGGWSIHSDATARASRVKVLTTSVPFKSPATQVLREGRNLIICCDGTANSPDALDETGRVAKSNVYKLFESLKDDAESMGRQLTFYDAGVSTGTSAESRTVSLLLWVAEMISAHAPAGVLRIYQTLIKLGEAALGIGISENIIDGYMALSRLYRPGDKIFLIGFSRGAYTARCIASLIDKCGLLRAENARFAPDIYALYRFRDTRDGASDHVKIAEHLLHAGVRIHALGVWDTVASLGLPLWGWWFRVGRLWRNQSFIDRAPAAVCDHVYHAVSMDERRSQFFVTLFHPSANANLEQVWFRGSHAGVGGGYHDSRLSDVSLQWMMERPAMQRLMYREGLPSLQPSAHGTLHNELERKQMWHLFGSWPRWYPCERPTGHTPRRFGSIHESAFDRSDEVARAMATTSTSPLLHPEELRLLAIDESVSIDVRADWIWNRSGLVIESDAIYRIEYQGGSWQDKETGECSVEGQPAVSGLRKHLGWIRRCERAHWMELVLMVAIPRDWDLKERPFRDLLKFLLITDPVELTDSLLPVGRLLSGSHTPVYLSNQGNDAGMLYGFANDAWLFYLNNSGAIRLKITRIAQAPENATLVQIPAVKSSHSALPIMLENAEVTMTK